jgi:hypothetical protein
MAPAGQTSRQRVQPVRREREWAHKDSVYFTKRGLSNSPINCAASNTAFCTAAALAGSARK